MDYYAFPNNVYDQPANLLAVLGSWWAKEYAGRNQVVSIVRGKAQVEQQTILDLMELIASLSRFTVPIYHRDNWYPLYVKLSEKNTVDATIAKYDEGLLYDEGHRYDVAQVVENFSFPIDNTLVEAPVILNRFTDPTLTWTENIDYRIDDGFIVFQKDPFNDARIATRTLYDENGNENDTEAILWIYRGQWDWEYIYEQFGYVLGAHLQSSQGYRQLMNAIYDAIVSGTTKSDVLLALSAMTGIPLVKEDTETVEDITNNGEQRIVITDQHVYKFDLEATPVVEIGDVLTRSQSLTDALEVFELNRGELPNNLDSLAMGPGFLATCFYADLIFENRDVPLIVDEDHESGYTKVSWQLGGFPLDVDKFFDDLHTRGVVEAEKTVDECETTQTISYPANDCDEVSITGRRGTIAHLLDRRTVQVGEPTASQLPATINPLEFLIENVLRNNAYIVRVKAVASSAEVGLHNARLLRMVFPPHTAGLLVVELTAKEDNLDSTNFSEQVSTFVGTEPQSDSITSSMVEDGGPVISVVSGTCY